MSNLLARFFRDESATASLDYAIIGGLVSILIVIGATAVGTGTSASFQNAATKMS